MPCTPEEIQKTKLDFYEVAGFPGVLGCIDCTHIPIIAPSDDEYAYANRKGFHSVNVQAICNANMEFTNVTARWPGGSHDSCILGHSMVGQRFASEEHVSGWLLGDSGYGLKKWLMTPFANPNTEAKKKFNNSLTKNKILCRMRFWSFKKPLENSRSFRRIFML